SSFNAATANSPWRTGEPRLRRQRFQRFNAATANSPWRTGTIMPTSRIDGVASMRPRRIRRGEPLQASCASSTRRTLQCGHVEFAVENFLAGAEGQLLFIGFNAATANSPWRTPLSMYSDLVKDPLQCGHGEFAVENARSAAATGAASNGFNAATAN